MKAGTKSKMGNTYAQAFCTSYGWSRMHPMSHKSEAHEALSVLFQRDGVPPKMVADNSKEQTLGNFARKCREADCHLTTTEPYSPWMQAAEGCIKHCKQGSARKMLAKGSPKRLWDHSLELEAFVRSHTALDIYGLRGQVPETILKGNTADISFISEFEWFQWVMYYNPGEVYPNAKAKLGRYLGPAIGVGTAMTHKVLLASGNYVCRPTVRALTPSEEVSEDHKSLRKAFMDSVHDALGPACVPDDFEDEDLTPEHEFYEDDEQEIFEGNPDEPLPPTPEVGDNYVGARVTLPFGDGEASGRVAKRARDKDGNPIGRANANPILDTREYVIEFDDGQKAELAANVIAQNMYAQCDADGNNYLLLESIVDHRRSTTALTYQDQIIKKENGRTYMRKSTAGWQLCVEWKDGSTSWQRLSDLKESHPVQVAEYAHSQSLMREPAFDWWAPHVLKRRDRIISLVKKRNARYLKKHEKYGIRLPKTVKEAIKTDEDNGNTLWQDAIAKEMKNVRPAFQVLENGQPLPNRNYQYVECHMIFDVKMEDFRRKARLVAGGHMTEAPAAITYASVVSRETVRIALTLAALNDLEVKVGDVMNAYITAPCSEKIWTKLGPEFGADEGKRAVVVRALYGLKSSGAAFRKHLGECMQSLEYKSCLADPDLWMKAAVRPDGTEYYSYILNYVDDIMVIHHDAMPVLEEINKFMLLKPDSVGDPDIYLGAKVKRAQLENDIWCWTISPSKYVQEAVRNCENHIKNNFDEKYSFYKNAPNPFEQSYDPDMDITPVLNPEQASYYNSLIGILRWMVELGRLDICTEVSMLASYLAMPREGHLDAAIHIMSYLKGKHNSRLVLDPSYARHDKEVFIDDADWRPFYGDVKEALPPNAPKPLGREVELRMFVDSDHAGDKASRRSRTGFMIFMNMALINFLSKKQPTVESAVFGAEFVAMKHGVETLRGIRYKLRMMGVEISGPTYVYGDNMSVTHNTSKPESVLKKKSNSICYHFVREAVAMRECVTSHIPTSRNVADLLTKVLFGSKRRNLVSSVLADIYDYFGDS